MAECSCPLALCCSEDNDLCQALRAGGTPFARFDDPGEAVAAAPKGSAVLVLADGYPAKTTQIPRMLLVNAARRRLRLYIEFADRVPGVHGKEVRKTAWERSVVASDFFGSGLDRLRIVQIHDCHFVPIELRGRVEPDLVVARVAGFDTAVYGLPEKEVWPILFRHPHHEALIATTKLSQFITARYAPTDAWRTIWSRILAWLTGQQTAPPLRWAATVRPSFGPRERLPADAERQAFERGADWFTNSRLFMHRSWKHELMDAHKHPERLKHLPQTTKPLGDGREGMLEGFTTSIRYDGNQEVRWCLRDDCIGEGTMAMAWSGVLRNIPLHRKLAANCSDFVYCTAPWQTGPRVNPKHPSYGLLSWAWPGNEHIYYGDDNARCMLGTMAASCLLRSTRWDEPLLRALLANFRTSDKLGFRPLCLTDEALEKKGWRGYFDAATPYYSAHLDSWLWACLLWTWRHTGYRPLLDRMKTAIRMMVAVYPDHWRWTNGIQQERARMLLPLAWLVRAEDTAEHRGWLRKIATELLASQDACGAIREEIGSAGQGMYNPPASNEKYGTDEAPLIQKNGDPLADLLYTTNFAFLGLHEAAAATGERLYRRANDKLAEFLCRIQARSEKHRELDGAWFRAFDFRRWESWASNADLGWGAWSIEAGWTQAWITSVFAMRLRKTSLWDVTAKSKIGRVAPRVIREMLEEKNEQR